MILNNNDWLTPGRTRQLMYSGGPFAMATMILSGHYDPAYPPATRFMIEFDDPKLTISWARKLKLNLIYPTAGHGFPPEDERDQERWLAEMVAEAHHYDIAVIPYISLTNIYRDRFERLHPECIEWYARDIHGNEVPYAAGRYIPGRRPPRLMACLSSPGWWGYLSAKMDRVADTGVDGLYYDNIFSTCFCSRCQEAFADFSQKRLGQRLVFQEMQQFDKASFMGGGIEVVASADQVSEQALVEKEFRMSQIVGMLSRLKQRFTERTGKSILVCNAHNRPLLNDNCELILTEDGIEAGVLWAKDFAGFQKRNKGFPGLGEALPLGQEYRLCTNAALYKYMAGDGGYDKPWSNFQHPIRYRSDQFEPMKPVSWKRSVAESHAFGGNYLLITTHFFLPGLEQPAIISEVVNYHKFFAKRRDVWDAIYPVSDTLVPTWDITNVERALGELALLNYPFEVAPVLQLTVERLTKYKTLVFLEEAALMQMDKQALAAFAQRGGNILLLGLAAELPDVPAASVHYLPEMNVEMLVQNLEGKVVSSLKQELIHLNGTSPWEVIAPPGVVANLAVNRRGDRWVLYLINLWDEPLHNIKVLLRGLPKSPPVVTAYTPDRYPGVKRIKTRLNRARNLVFRLPTLLIYTAIEII